MCNCVEKHQERPCNRFNGKCHCLSNYSGLKCELPVLSTRAGSTETPTQSNRAAITAGATVGSVVVLLLFITLVVIIAVAVQMVLHVHKTRDVRLRISPSQQFESQTQLQKVTYKPLAPPDEQIPAAEVEMIHGNIHLHGNDEETTSLEVGSSVIINHKHPSAVL